MSSRALRKAQRELEERRLREQHNSEEEEEEEEEEDLPAPVTSKPGLFALLGAQDADEDEDEEEPEDVVEEQEETSNKPDVPSSAQKKKKKKKKRAKKKAGNNKDEDLDEIDKALRDLAVSKSAEDSSNEPRNDQSTLDLQKLLSVSSQYLHAVNEMRRLFGRAAMEENQEAAPADGRRRGRGGQEMGLAAAVAGRNMPGGRNLASLGLRRNIFIQGKEEWPKATSGGLGMEVVEKKSNGIVEFKFVHNSMYRDVQNQFATCVASMDPERMVHLLQYNPYHISTLLQVSEIAKQQRDPATSGDLLERALFTFGRSVHSTFSACLSEGRARLDFARPENREFWLAGWRYIGNLGLRSTWRTAFEWAKLLLSLSPESDPYCMCLIIDQLAIRGRQADQFIELVNHPLFEGWQGLPNITLSLGLAHHQNGDATNARKTLKEAVERFPWVVARLFQELDIEPVPPSVWGLQPPDHDSELLQELYVIKGKDIWNTPEATSLLVEVASSVSRSSTDVPAPAHGLSPRDYTRHVLLTDTQPLLTLLPRELVNEATSASDPLPPTTNLSTYTPTSNPGHIRDQISIGDFDADANGNDHPGGRINSREAFQTLVGQFQAQYTELRDLFQDIISSLPQEQRETFERDEVLPPIEDLERAGENMGLRPGSVRQAAQTWAYIRDTLHQLQERLEGGDLDA